MPEILPFPQRPSREKRTAHSPMVLEVRDLAYRSECATILAGLNLTLQTDALTVLLGPNGAGKSVFLRLLHGLLRPTSGAILWNGMPPGEAVRKEQALVFQKPVLLRRSVKANLKFALGLRGGRNRRERLHLALEQAGLTDMADRSAHVLSGGEQQRLALARALILEPKVLFLDEPTANLDPASTFMIEQTVGQVRRQGMKIILVTHDLNQARRLGEEVVFLHKGRLLEHDPADRFFRKAETPEARAYLAGDILI
ncbi:ATP-binding cassette domain-containing protein [Roseibium sp. RKSG952]|uniref:ATP-binding cassette domain-containing protein n=1 Tax=Roseibium sp. RKSG952 TaxID=2529384 RepID=UPI0012BC8FB6|nr:ATP-binding cassette domain-containing protein [Roseibium sp. RKSG952]MTH98316.1 ATP-binding cassette domain-containing protein [Roseibium sp. RKSG952]